jgi:hypothetical protein
MKKIIQLVSFLGLALIFSGVEANAQSVTNVDAKIPFDFVIGDKALAAGDYTLRISSTPSGARRLEVRDSERETVYSGLIQTNGNRNSQRAELKFNRAKGNSVLSKIIMGDAGYTVPTEHSGKLIAAGSKSKATVRN